MKIREKSIVCKRGANAGSRKDHVGLENHPLQEHTLGAKLLEYFLKAQQRRFAASLEGMIAIHQHFRFDHGDESGLLTLANRLIVADDTADILTEPSRGDDELSIRACRYRPGCALYRSMLGRSSQTNWPSSRAWAP